MRQRAYRFFTWTTLLGLLVVVIAGSLVKATDSGMGCPDWPKCFGHFIPPMDEAEVQWDQGKSFFEGQMILHEGALWTAKTDFTSQSQFSPSKWDKFEEHPYVAYRPIHTFIEYINRLATVLLGFFALGMLVFAFFQKEHKILHRILSVFTVVLIGYEAWLGRQVVESVLAAEKISKHLYAAFLLVIITAIAAAYTRRPATLKMNKTSRILGWTSIVLLSTQLFLGTQLREIFDGFYAEDNLERNYWIENAGIQFLVHRSFSLVYLGVLIALYIQIKETLKQDRLLKNSFSAIGLIVLLEILSGVVMAYFEVPRFMQPTHVFLSASLLCANTYFLVRFLRKP